MPHVRTKAWVRTAVTRGAAVLAMAVLASCATRPREAPLPLAGGTPSEKCAACHPAIYKEWRESGHASAYVRPDYRLATRDYQETDCLPCHIRKNSDTPEKPAARSSHLDEGVNCESCHLSQASYAAPKVFGKYQDHVCVERPLLAKSEFCGSCHEAVFKQWSEAKVEKGKRKSCQECHMPTERRKTVSGSFWYRLHPKVDVHRHHFAMVAPAKGEANITVAAALTQVTTDVVAAEVTLTNVAAQHALPSGEGGFRELALVASLVDRYGVASAKRIEPFLAQKKRVLAYGKPEVISLRFLDAPPDVEALEVKLVRSSHGGVDAVLHVERLDLRLPQRQSGD